MKSYSKKELEWILAKHQMWLKTEGGEQANLANADLRYAGLRRANLTLANLIEADLTGADLFQASLYRASLNRANLKNANLGDTNLRYTNLSGVKGLSSQITWLNKHLKTTPQGYVAYKIFDIYFPHSKKWEIKPGGILTEVVNFDRIVDCACGINVATLKWCKNVVKNKKDIWKVLIRYEWAGGICVPYNTAGKFRCEKIELIKIVHRKVPHLA